MNPYPEARIGVVGAGSWGTTLANMLARKGYPVTVWVYEHELLELLHATRENSWYLPDILLDRSLRFTGDLPDAVADKDLVLWVTPVRVFHDLFSAHAGHALPDCVHVSASKGIENARLQTVSQMASAYLDAAAQQRFTVLSGPSFAYDLSRDMPTAVSVAAACTETAAHVQRVLATPYFRTYTSDDVIGVELGGALKNVMAIAAGIIDGLGLGHNTRAALITRGLAEMMRLGTCLGAAPLTFSGLSGMGDLILTCTSTRSRNYRVGVEIGRGRSLEEVMSGMKMVAEGVPTTRSTCELAARVGVELPIVEETAAILFEGRDPMRAVRALMGRDLKQEHA